MDSKKVKTARVNFRLLCECFPSENHIKTTSVLVSLTSVLMLALLSFVTRGPLLLCSWSRFYPTVLLPLELNPSFWNFDKVEKYSRLSGEIQQGVPERKQTRRRNGFNHQLVEDIKNIFNCQRSHRGDRMQPYKFLLPDRLRNSCSVFSVLAFRSRDRSLV